MIPINYLNVNSSGQDHVQEQNPREQGSQETALDEFHQNGGISGELDDPVLTEARNNLSESQRERVDKRMEKVNSYPGYQPGESSRGKGKAVDPRNWGNVELDE
ncbi:hypothetical protein H0H93_003711, partial [Arthromyces matolae]